MNPDTKPKALSKVEASCLLYLEACAVDADGLVEGRRMNADDHAAARRFREDGLAELHRIPARLLGADTGGRWYTHWVRLTDAGFDRAHRLRRERAARPPRRASYAAGVVAALEEDRRLSRAAPPPVPSGAAAGPRRGTNGEPPAPGRRRMSRYEIHRDGKVVVVGWDNPLQTFFAQVWDGHAYAAEDADPLLWVGGRERELTHPDDLVRSLGRYGALLDGPSGAVLDRLRADRAAAVPPTPLQRLLGTWTREAWRP